MGMPKVCENILFKRPIFVELRMLGFDNVWSIQVSAITQTFLALLTWNISIWTNPFCLLWIDWWENVWRIPFYTHSCERNIPISKLLSNMKICLHCRWRWKSSTNFTVRSPGSFANNIFSDNKTFFNSISVSSPSNPALGINQGTNWKFLLYSRAHSQMFAKFYYNSKFIKFLFSLFILR